MFEIRISKFETKKQITMTKKSNKIFHFIKAAPFWSFGHLYFEFVS